MEPGQPGRQATESEDSRNTDDKSKDNFILRHGHPSRMSGFTGDRLFKYLCGRRPENTLAKRVVSRLCSLSDSVVIMSADRQKPFPAFEAYENTGAGTFGKMGRVSNARLVLRV